MLTGSERLRRGAAACVLAAAACANNALADEDASAWDGDTRGAVRLIAGSAQPANSLRAGLEIRLKPGWHTYWRYPGDAGVPPRLNFTGSENVHAVNVLWPAPQRILEQGLTAIGYTGDVLLPLSVVPQTGSKPMTLRLTVEYAVCEKLCVPAQASLQLALTDRNSSYDTVLAAARSRVPKRRAIGEGSGLAIASVHRDGAAPRPRGIIEVVAPPLADVDLFVEGPTADWALPIPIPLDPPPNGLRRRFAFDLDGAPPGAKYEGALLTVTAAMAGNAIEVSTPLK